MRFMMFMYPDEKAEVGALPDAALVSEMMKYNEELAKADALISLEGLHPSSKGARIKFSGGKPVVTDGPFVESKEVIGGYWLIDVKSKEEAIGWAKKIPARGSKMIEVRQVFEMTDFPEDVQKAADNPTVREQVEKHKR
jgi:hypothetical protein